MATCGGSCGIEISCPGGCFVVCTTDCTDCTQGCEPTMVEAFVQMTRIVRKTGDAEIRTKVGAAGSALDLGSQKYPDDMEFRVCFHDVSRATIASVLTAMSRRKMRASEVGTTEKLSATETGTVAELAAKYALVLE